MHYYGYIYKTTNLINGKIYIGQRKGEFYPYYYGSGIHFLRALKLHGRNNFKVNLITYAKTKDILNRLEKKYIDNHRKRIGKKRMYNIADGGGGRSCPFTEEHKLKLSKILSGRPLTEEHKLKIKKSHSNPETKRKCIESHKGKYPSEMTRRKMSLSNSGKKSVNFGKRWIVNKRLCREKSVSKENILYYLNNGWVYGRKPMSNKQKQKISKSKIMYYYQTLERQ